MHPGYQFLLTRPLRDVTEDSLLDDSQQGFLLTRPLRDVTVSDSVLARLCDDFYSHAPYGT